MEVNLKMLSIIIPVYKIQKNLLERCIESVINQIGLNDEYEIILVDDGSPDDCGMICDLIANKYSAITSLHKQNGGLASARNYGMRHSKGEYITFLDADDWIEADFYSSILNEMKKNDADIGIGGICIDDGRKSTPIGEKSDLKVMNASRALRDMYQKKGFIWSVCDKIYKRESLNGLKFNERILYGEDSLFSFLSTSRSNLIVYVPSFGYHYFVRSNSMTHKYTEKQFLLIPIYKYIITKVMKEYPENIEIVIDFYISVLLNLMKATFDKKCKNSKMLQNKIMIEIDRFSYRLYCRSKILSYRDKFKLILIKTSINFYKYIII